MKKFKDFFQLFMFATALLVIFGCKKDKIDFDDEYVESVDIFSSKGGRVDWNVTTNKILMDQENEGRWDTYICNPDKSDMVNLTADMTDSTFGDQTVQSWQHRGQPAFSPNGDYIIFQVMNEHCSTSPETEELLSLGVNNDLWFMHSDGSHKMKLTNNPDGYSVLHPHFSHDGQKIIWAEKYAESNVSNFGSWRIKFAEILIDGNGDASLNNVVDLQPGGEKWYETHGFSSDDSKIYFSSNTDTDLKASDIFEYDLNSQTLVNISSSPKTWEEMHNINPIDENTYSYISSEFFAWNNNLGWGTLRTELYIYRNGEPIQLTYYNQRRKKNSKKLTKIHYFIGDHCWSPDGNSILAVLAEASFGNTNSKILKINLK